jgi:hypothetical protein
VLSGVVADLMPEWEQDSRGTRRVFPLDGTLLVPTAASSACPTSIF